MLKNISFILAGSILVFAGLVACDQVNEANDAATREADALRRGEAALAACIESQCETLDIDGMRLADYAVINGLTHVKILMASRTGFDDLADIADMQQLTELHITDTGITDLTGLTNFPKLKVLHFERMTTGVDIAPIAQLTGLTELALSELTEVHDVSFVKAMRRLENLKISWLSGDADLSILRGHPSLRNVDIDGSLPADQSALLEMPRLESISFTYAYMLNIKTRDELERRGVFNYAETIVVC